MKRRFLISGVMVIVLVFSLLLSACAKPAAEGPEEILVGCAASVTGAYAGMADGGVFGLKAAIEDINGEGGVFLEEYGRKLPIRLIVVDSESDPVRASSLAESLVLQDKVKILICHNEPTVMQVPVATVAANHKIPHLSNVAPMEPWLAMRAETSVPFDYTWALGFGIAKPAAAGTIWDQPGFTSLSTWKDALEAHSDQLNKKAGIFAIDDAAGLSWYGLYSKALPDLGFEVIGMDKDLGIFSHGTTDFTSMIQEWKDNDVEVLWGNAPAPDFGALWRQAHAMGFQPKLVSVSRAALYYTDVTAWGGDLPNGICTETFWQPEIKIFAAIGDTTPISLHERWLEEKNRPMNFAMGFGYQIIQVLVDSLERAGTLDTDAVLKAMGETDMMTIIGRVKFDQETRFCRTPIFYGQWQKTDTPEEWACPVVISHHDIMPATGEFLFPIPYE